MPQYFSLISIFRNVSISGSPPSHHTRREPDGGAAAIGGGGGGTAAGEPESAVRKKISSYSLSCCTMTTLVVHLHGTHGSRISPSHCGTAQITGADCVHSCRVLSNEGKKRTAFLFPFFSLFFLFLPFFQFFPDSRSTRLPAAHSFIGRCCSMRRWLLLWNGT